MRTVVIKEFAAARGGKPTPSQLDYSPGGYVS
jgi:hypothetical protein